MFPNPFTSHVNVTCPDASNAQIILFDGMGRELLRSRQSGVNTLLSLDNLMLGVYLLTVKSRNGSITKRVVKH